MTKEISRGICCGSHLAIMYGGEFLYLWIFSLLSLPNNLVKCELPFPRGLKSCTLIGYRAVNRAVTMMCADRAKSEDTITHLHT